MVAGHLREKRGYYHIVLSYTDENGKRQTPSKSTGLPVKGNKKRAEAMLQEARRTMEAELQLRQMEREKGYTDNPADILFTRFLLDWLEMMKASVEITTYAAYSSGIKNRIVPYFEEHHPGLRLRQVTHKAVAGLLHLRNEGKWSVGQYGDPPPCQHPKGPAICV